MRTIFHPALVNGPFGDPGLYVGVELERRSLLFDLGDLAGLPPKKILRVSDVFVTHTHMDHFVGFDQLLRTCVGRATAVRVYGPAGFVDQVEHRLRAYTWNLVHNYDTNFTITAIEVGAEGWCASARFQCRRRFEREALPARMLEDGVVMDDDMFRVRTAVLDHQIACLGFVLEEKTHVNVWKSTLAQLGLPVGPWLKALKRAVKAGAPDEMPFEVAWRDSGGEHRRVLPLRELKTALRFVPGQRIGYITDVIGDEANSARIASLVRDVDTLFIEAVFLDEDADHAARKYHLTAREAGAIARKAHAKTVVPFHMSPRYQGNDERIRAEVAEGFEGR